MSPELLASRAVPIESMPMWIQVGTLVYYFYIVWLVCHDLWEIADPFSWSNDDSRADPAVHPVSEEQRG